MNTDLNEMSKKELLLELARVRFENIAMVNDIVFLTDDNKRLKAENERLQTELEVQRKESSHMFITNELFQNVWKTTPWYREGKGFLIDEDILC